MGRSVCTHAAAFLGGTLAATAAMHCCAGAAVPRPSADPPRVRLAGQLQPAPDPDSATDPLRRLRKCETVIQRRTSRVVLVIERCNRSHNYSAVLRCVAVYSAAVTAVPPMLLCGH
jgi:hypothetical protein